MQMIDTARGHFYIYEPLELFDRKLVVPLFFYKSNNMVYAKCLKVEGQAIPLVGEKELVLYINAEPHFSSTDLTVISVENFWWPFPEIRNNDGKLLSVICGSCLYRKLFASHNFIHNTHKLR